MWEKQTSEAQERYGAGAGGDSYFKFKKGENRIRILEEGEMLATHFVGGKGYTCFGVKEGCPHHGEGAPRNEDGSPKKPSVKLITYVLDRGEKDQKPKQAEIPYSVIKQINTFATKKDYAFTSFPMPYDMMVDYDPKAGPGDMYKAIPSATRDEIPGEVIEEMSKVQRISQIVVKKKARAQKAAGITVDLDEEDYGEA